MITAINILCFGLIGVVAFIAIPSDVRSMIGANCLSSRGRIRPRYVLKEFAAVIGFFAQVFFAAILIACMVVVLLTLVDQHVVKMSLVGKAVSSADSDLGAWKQKLGSSPNNVKAEFLGDHIAKGGTKETGNRMMRQLWALVPVASLAIFALLVGCLRLTSKSYHQALAKLVKNEAARDLRRIKRRYLQSTAQAQMQSAGNSLD